MNKKLRLIEKKLYELLGVNIFRKYILFTYEKIMKKFGIDIGYRLKSISIYGIRNFRTLAKYLGFGHAIFGIAIFIVFMLWGNTFGAYFNLIINLYCTMVQRYNTIRFNEVEEKYNHYIHLKEEREHAEMKKRQKLNLSKKLENNLSSETRETPILYNNKENIKKLKKTL